jgi:plastocyanin
MIRSRHAALAAAVLALGTVHASAATVRVTLTSTPISVFVPGTITIRVGDTVRWDNVDGFHNVQADDDSWNSGSPANPPWTYSRTFTTAGTFGYFCVLHGTPGTGMFGTVTVLDSVELGHGSQVTEDLNGAPDLYRIGQKGYSSYEVVVDPVAGNPSLTLSRVDAGGTLIQPGLPLSSINMSQSLRWPNTTAADVNTERVRVSNASCGTACSTNDVYVLRAYETTLAIPRYNQTGSQATVVVLQNPTSYTIAGTVYFWNATGALVNPATFSIAPRAAFVLNAGTVANVAGTSGTITIAHNGRYGDLSGKAVALEPATGFTFDTQAVSRPR